MTESTEPELRPVVVIGGPTAVGKSSLAMELARRVGGEIINADSVQVYRGFDIGSAKATAEERAAIAHHLLDVCDAQEQFTAGQFVARTDPLVDELLQRRVVPIIVGGTGLYVRSLIEGLSEAPPVDLAIRAALEAIAQEHGNPEVHRMLAEVDPEAAAQIHRNDQVRSVRALEVFRVTGEPMSTWHARHNRTRTRYRTLLIGLTRPRAELYERVNLRVAQMLERGLLDEVRGLLEAGVAPNSAPMLALGYRHAVEHLEGKYDRAELERRMARDTRHFAKRQMTWFRNQLPTRWVKAPLSGQALDSLVEDVFAFMQGGAPVVGHDTPDEAHGLPD